MINKNVMDQKPVHKVAASTTSLCSKYEKNVAVTMIFGAKNNTMNIELDNSNGCDPPLISSTFHIKSILQYTEIMI